jgi:hypothetical protein
MIYENTNVKQSLKSSCMFDTDVMKLIMYIMCDIIICYNIDVYYSSPGRSEFIKLTFQDHNIVMEYLANCQRN